ncbi:MAG TPA: hypothetical protein VGK21_06755 [Candidatus Angelobacter sp.]
MRNSRILLPLCLLASVVSSGQPEPHDLKITTRQTFNGNEFTTTIYYSGENSRSEMQIFSGNVKGHRRAIIRQKGAESIQVYDLDLDAHEYVSYQTNLLGVTPGAKSIALKPSGKIYVINTDVVDTDERKEMFGHTARHLITKEKRTGGPENCYGGKTETEIDGWYIDYDVMPASQRPKTGVSAHLVSHVGGMGSSHCSDKIETHRTGPQTGFPLKEMITLTGETTLPDNSASSYKSVSQIEVVEFAESPLDPALFKVPADFRKVDHLTDPTQRPLALTYWERFKAELWDIFH